MDATVLGAGISGLSAAYHLRKHGFTPTLYEKEGEAGGLCKSGQYDGLVFDYGPHISFTSNEYVKGLFKDSVAGDYDDKQVSCLNYWRGYWIEHEPQNNLHSLPNEIVRDILLDVIHAKYDGNAEIMNYRDWCQKNFGVYFSKNFTDKYTRKFWTVEPQELTTDWIGVRVNPQDLGRMIDGALNTSGDNTHYASHFIYPRKGGFSSFLRLLEAESDIRLGTYPIEVDLQKRKIRFNKGIVEDYGILVSSIPLPELIACIKNAPQEVCEAVNRLKWTSLRMLNFRVDHRASSPSQWNYYYDEDIPYTRIVYMSRFSEDNAPGGCETMQAEIPYSPSKPLALEGDALTDEVVRCITRTEGIAADELEYLGDFDIKYGYVIHDIERKKALHTIHTYLDENDVYYCGRFGEWAYLWSDQALLSGMRVAEKIKQSISPDLI
ncbi:MAG: FAD-dependent oxidoreductase [Candidatus Altiarchaeota archaeon]